MAGLYKTFTEIARAAGVVPQTAKAWTLDPKFPKREAGGWPCLPALQYASRHMADHAKQITGNNADIKSLKIKRQVEKLNEDIRRARADANMSELEAKRQAGALMERAEHVRLMESLARLFVAGLEPLPRDLAALCPDASVVSALRAKIDVLRDRIAAAVDEARL